MSVKIRLQRKGRKKQPYYHIVVADARAPRDGRFIENIGMYNPLTKPATIELDRDRAFYWLEQGAQPTDTARAILRFKGLLYKKHLMRGVKKGALSLEQAEAKFKDWVDAKEAKVAERFEHAAKEKAEYYAKLSGTAPMIEEPVVEEEAVAEEEVAVEAEAGESPKASAEEEE